MVRQPAVAGIAPMSGYKTVGEEAEMANVHKATCGPAWQNCPTRLAKGERTLDIRLAAQREMLRLCFAGESSHGRRRRRLPGAAQFRSGFIRAVRRGLSATHGRGIWACRCVLFCGSHLVSNGLFFSPNAYQHLAEDVNCHGEDGYREIWAVDEKRQQHFFSLSESASKTGGAFA